MKLNRFELKTLTIFSVFILAFSAIASTAPHSGEESSAHIVQGQALETPNETNVLLVGVLLGAVAVYAVSMVWVASNDYFEALWQRDHKRGLDEAYYLALEDVFPRRVAGWRYFVNYKMPGASLEKKMRSGKSY